MVHPPHEAKYRPLEKDYEICRDIAGRMATRVKNDE
jgi:hypothetical protein